MPRTAAHAYLAGPMDWMRWREEFPILAQKTYLNSCSLGALSRRAEARIATFHAQWHSFGAAAWYEPWLKAITELRGRVAAMLRASPAEIALTASTSVALSSIASCLDYRTRPRVVLAELDFPTLGYQWMVKPGVEVVRVASDDQVTIDPQRYADAIDNRTAVLAVSHVFFTTGAIQDLRTLADIAHAKDALLVVDAYQGIGQVDLDVRAAGVDILTTGPLKWLLGGPGLAYLYVREDLIRQLVPTIAGWFGAARQFSFDSSHFEFHDDARRFEMGTPAVPTVHSALGGQEIIDEIGVALIQQRNRVLTDRLVAGAQARGFRLRAARDSHTRSAIVMVAHDDPGTAVAQLAARGIIVDWRPGHVRISPHFYNTEAEIDCVLDALDEGRA